MRNRSMALVVRNKSILLVREKIDGREFYTLPGGGIENNETPEEAALRELKEECGLEGTIVKPLCINYRRDGSMEYTFWINVSDNQKSIVGKDPEEDDDNQIIMDVKWIAINDLSEKDRAFLWSYGLMDINDFGKRLLAGEMLLVIL